MEGLPHPECDLRGRGRIARLAVGEYAWGRIEESYDFLATQLEPCADLEHGSAYDVGSGAGFVSFALGSRFDRVLAVDPNVRAMVRARLLARIAGVKRISFEVADAERLRPDAEFDLIFCNGMSHNAGSRVGLLRRLADCAADGSWMIYLEVTQGYVPMELEQSIAGRDSVTTRDRLRQLVCGLAGYPRFRFFVADTVQPLIGRLGFEVVKEEKSSWGSLPAVQRVWCRRTGEPDAVPGEHEQGDYGTRSPELTEVRERTLRVVDLRARGRSADSEHAANAAWAAASDNPLAPLLLLVQIADVALPSLDAQPGSVERLGDRARSRLGGGSLDWERLSELFEGFRDAVDSRAGARSPDVD